MQFWKTLYINRRLYWLLITAVIMFLLGIFSPVFFWCGITVLVLTSLTVGYDLYLLYTAGGSVQARRDVGDRLSNGDHNEVIIRLRNTYSHLVHIRVIDELPEQFQRRDVEWRRSVKPGEQDSLKYTIRPTKRGEYAFGAVRVFVMTFLQLIMRRFTFEAGKAVKVYPSYLQLRHYAFLAFDKRLQDTGLKKIRRIGHTMEFEQIKEYVIGDDTRVMNWKATARAAKPMVNQFQDERAQPVYCIIDKGRLMKMPFDEMTLLDYAINATLVMSYIAIHKSDKAGLITFSHRLEDIVVAGRRSNQMYKITEALYKQKTDFKEADFQRLASGVLKKVRNRSLMILMTNFESLTGLKRQLPYLKALSDRHVVVVVFFQNTALREITETKADTLRGIYRQTIAEKFLYEKRLMVRLLATIGIHAVLTTPQDLTVDTINQYLALKARGVI